MKRFIMEIKTIEKFNDDGVIRCKNSEDIVKIAF